MTVVKGLMQGKRGLVMGVANDHSIAYGIARILRSMAPNSASPIKARCCETRGAARRGTRLRFLLPCDVEDISTVDAAFDRLKREWGEIDFIVHSIGYSDKNELKGLYADTSRENFIRTMVISCFSFTEVAKRAAAMMKNGGSF